jgi:cytochrome c553
MDSAVIYKQLDDYRSGKRLWGVMGAMAKSLSAQDSADVAAYFAAQQDGLPAIGSNRVPESGRSLREADPAQRLVFAGDPQRGIPPCSACHGPGGYKLGAPALEGQHAAHISNASLPLLRKACAKMTFCSRYESWRSNSHRMKCIR